MRDLQAGASLGHYELVLRIAKGGMGEVWAARVRSSRGFQKLFAVKTLLPELSQDPNFEQMFLDEASLTAKIKHPNVVEVIDLGDEGEILYQAMEWVEGASLWAIMRAAAKRKQRIPLLVAASVVRQAAAGLHAAHELRDDGGNLLGLVHRDVSPQNVLITPQGVAKIADFGVARFTGRSSMVTQQGELRGKVPYMAPEAIRAQPIDRRADVFALGLMLYQLVSGNHPFLGDDDHVTLARIVDPRPSRPLIELCPEVPPALSELVARALAKDPAARTATASELMRELDRAVPGSGSDDGREAVAAFCKGLGPEYFPVRVRELREALRRLDSPDGTGSGRASLTSLVDGSGSNPSIQAPSHPSLRQPLTPPPQTPQPRTPPPQTPAGVEALEALPVPKPRSRAPLVAAAIAVIAVGVVVAFVVSAPRVDERQQAAEAKVEAPKAAPAPKPSAQPPAASASAQPSAAPEASGSANVMLGQPVVLGGPWPSAHALGSAKAPKRDPDKKSEQPAGEFKPGGI